MDEMERTADKISKWQFVVNISRKNAKFPKILIYVMYTERCTKSNEYDCHTFDYANHHQLQIPSHRHKRNHNQPTQLLNKR